MSTLGLCCCTQAFSLVEARGVTFCCRASHCSSVSCWGAQALGGLWASVVVVHGLSFPTPCGIFPDQGLNLCSLHWQGDS